jgi:hypothetical protein
MPLVTVQEHNLAAEAIASSQIEIPTGIACPLCAEEIMRYEVPPVQVITPKVVDLPAFCSACAWTGTIRWVMY